MAGGDAEEVAEDLLSHTPALLGVKLRGKEIVLVDGRTVGKDVIGHGNRMLADGHVVTVDEIDEVALMETFHQRRLELTDLVPPHCWDLVLMKGGLETLHINVEDAKAVGVAFLGMAAEQLLADADAKNGLSQRTDDLVKTMAAQVVHRAARLSLSGEQHPVGMAECLGVVSQPWNHSEPSEGAFHGIDVSCVVFYYGDFHLSVSV